MSDDANPHSMLRTTSQPCEIHTRHIPESRVNHRHHIWPQGQGGPNIEDNIAVVCPTGHYNIHDLLNHYISMMGKVPYEIKRRYSLRERELAELGYKRLTRKAM